MNKHADRIDLMVKMERSGKKTHLRLLPSLNPYEFSYWEAFVQLGGDVSFTQVKSYCETIGENDVLGFHEILRTIQETVSNG